MSTSPRICWRTARDPERAATKYPRLVTTHMQRVLMWCASRNRVRKRHTDPLRTAPRNVDWQTQRAPPPAGLRPPLITVARASGIEASDTDELFACAT